MSTKCSYSKEVNTSSPPDHARAVVAMENGRHEVLVLERGQHLFTAKHARAVVAIDNGKHVVLVLEIGQNLFTAKPCASSGGDGKR